MKLYEKALCRTAFLIEERRKNEGMKYVARGDISIKHRPKSNKELAKLIMYACWFGREKNDTAMEPK